MVDVDVGLPTVERLKDSTRFLPPFNRTCFFMYICKDVKDVYDMYIIRGFMYYICMYNLCILYYMCVCVCSASKGLHTLPPPFIQSYVVLCIIYVCVYLSNLFVCTHETYIYISVCMCVSGFYPRNEMERMT